MDANINTTQERIETIGEQLRAKISSKFQASIFLAGFAFSVLGIQISSLWQSQKLPRLFPLSLSLIAASVYLYLLAIVRLDELTMPKRFWKEGSEKIEPSRDSRLGYLSDDDLWNLHDRMVFYWRWLTVVATRLAVFSLLCMLLPLSPWEPVGSGAAAYKSLLWIIFKHAVICAFFLFIYLRVLTWHAKKKLKLLLRPID